MSAHTVLWTSPQPLWGRFGALGAGAFVADDQARPAVLRFASDEFMDQLLAMLAADPRRIGEIVARPETWRTPGGETPDLVERVPLPRIARALARIRKAEVPSTAIAATTSQVSASENGVPRTIPLKLYQAAHQRYYLVAANLVCGVPGFPDRAVATGGREQVGFVLRRMLPVASASPSDLDPPREEYAFVKDRDGARWQRVIPLAGARDPWAVSSEGEELLPLFPLNFRDDVGHPRRIHAGVVPVGRREEYMSTRAQATPPAPVPTGGTGTGAGAGARTTRVSELKEQLKREVVEPWKNLIRTAHTAVGRLSDVKAGVPPSPPTLPDRQRAAAAASNAQLQGSSWLLLLDFADYLAHHLDPVWQAVIDASDVKGGQLDGGSGPRKNLFDWLKNTGAMSGSDWPLPTGAPALAASPSLRAALASVATNAAVRTSLEGAVRTFPDPPDGAMPGGAGGTLAWPTFGFLLAGVKRKADGSYEAVGPYQSLGGVPAPAPDPDDVEAPPPVGSVLAAVEAEVARLDKLVQLVIAAVDTSAPLKAAPPLPFAARLRDALKSTNGDAGWFVLRCVYVRRDCGPLDPPVLSAPSQRFQLASFFDPDAPARPIRITLPLDTTPAGLRKHDRNTALILSDVLCGQVQRAKGLGFVDLVLSVLPWPFHKDLDVGGMGPCDRAGINIGMICSLSIPIITICALILLIIIVTLLDFIFRWLPFFIFCFPVPGLKAKKPA